MKQYLKLLADIQLNGDIKDQAREGMPPTKALFGPQMKFDLRDGFPIVTTKEVNLKAIAVELIWFLRKESNIQFLVQNGVNIWNEDAYNYFKSQFPESNCTLKQFTDRVKLGLTRKDGNGYKYGDTGHQYPKVWRDFGGTDLAPGVDQIAEVINNIINNPESRRHVISAVDVNNQKDLALYWCHSLFQFNCVRIPEAERESVRELYYLDCKLYQRSADSVLGVPYNISSYALLTLIVGRITNMKPRFFIHSFGDVHIYGNHQEAVKEQLTRTPLPLPKLYFTGNFEELLREANSIDNLLMGLHHDMFYLDDYKHDYKISAKLNTGLVDNAAIQGGNANEVLWDAVKPTMNGIAGKIILGGTNMDNSGVTFKDLWDKAETFTPQDLDGNPTHTIWDEDMIQFVPKTDEPDVLYPTPPESNLPDMMEGEDPTPERG